MYMHRLFLYWLSVSYTFFGDFLELVLCFSFVECACHPDYYTIVL